MEERSSGSKHIFSFLPFSFFLNLFLLYLLYSRQPERLTWTMEAALEAEAVASLSCSGHGRAFLDGTGSSQGKPACDCYACYGGADCSLLLPDCPADADSGDPLFLEPFWMQRASSSAVVVSGWHRMSYSMAKGTSISFELLNQIRKLHSVIGNANATGKFIVFGDGSTQLFNAAVLALLHNKSAPSRVVAAAPYYGGYESQMTLFQCKGYEYEWMGDAVKWKDAADSSANYIEFVTSPNNPDGLPKSPVLEGPFTKSIHDHAYYWPHFTAIRSVVDEDVMLFTLSKLTGHAGSRFGWALIKDAEVYKKMSEYTSYNTAGVSHDSMLRALKVLSVVLKDGGRDLFQFGYATLSDRWQKLSNILSLSRRFSIQKMDPHFCNYFQRTIDPSPAYAWLKCEREEDEDCPKVMRDAGIIGRPGPVFGVSKRFIRLSLIKSQDDFEWLLHQINKLVSNQATETSTSEIK